MLEMYNLEIKMKWNKKNIRIKARLYFEYF